MPEPQTLGCPRCGHPALEVSATCWVAVSADGIDRYPLINDEVSFHWPETALCRCP